MGVFNPQNVKISPGTLYAAPLGTAEPVSVTGAWVGWTALGYTEQGSEFDFGPTVAPVMVEEEYDSIRNVVTAYTAKITFIMAELTRQNLALALNAGIGSSIVASSQGANADGSLWQERPDPGTEVSVMLGWDSLQLGATAGADPFQRLIIRQALQDSAIKRVARKGNNKSSWSTSWTAQKPNTGLRPFRFINAPNLGS